MKLFTHFIFRDRKQLYIGDDNPLTLIVNAQNEGEGAYEAELYIELPPQADYVGVVRNNKVNILNSCALQDCMDDTKYYKLCCWTQINMNSIFLLIFSM